MKTCKYCSKEFQPQRTTAEYCSDKCRVDFKREGAPKMLPADRAYADKVSHMEEWLIWTEVHEAICKDCKKKFQTRLQLLRSCGC